MSRKSSQERSLVALFSRSKTAEPALAPEPEPIIVAEKGPRKKDAPTPTRKQAERERMQRLHPALTPKQQKQLERQMRAEENRKALIEIENTPIRQLARDVVDSSFHIGEVSMPMLLALAFASIILPQQILWFNVLVTLSCTLLALVILDSWLTWRRVKKAAAQQLPRVSTKGLGMYVFNRVIQFRRFRNPKPRVKIGQPLS